MVLIVDDDQSIREAVEVALEIGNHPTASVADGMAALEWLHHHPPPSLIILDLMMPVMDGWQVLEELREDERLGREPIVVLTAFGRDLGSAARFPILRKPVELPDLLAAVDKYSRPEA